MEGARDELTGLEDEPLFLCLLRMGQLALKYKCSHRLADKIQAFSSLCFLL